MQSFAIPLAGTAQGWDEPAAGRSGIVVLRGSGPTWRDLAARLAAAAHLQASQVDGFYLADPSGSVIMRYEPDADLQGMLGDLQRLLKFTWAGR